MRDTIQCPDLVIAAAGTFSDPFVHALVTGDAESITIQSPATLPEAGTIEVSLDFDVNYQKNGLSLADAVSAATWADLVDSTGTAIAIGGAGEAMVIMNFGAAAWRIGLAAAGAERTFKVYKLVAS